MIQRLVSIAMFSCALATSWVATAESSRLQAVAGNDWKYSIGLQPPNGWAVQQFEDLIEIRFPGLSSDLILPTAIRPPLTDVTWEQRDNDLYLRFVVACSCSVAVTTNTGAGLTLEFIERNLVAAVPAPLNAPFPPPKSATAAAAVGKASVKTATGELDVDEARARLMKQLLRAAEAGLIEMDPGPEAAVAETASKEGAASDVANHKTGADRTPDTADKPKTNADAKPTGEGPTKPQGKEAAQKTPPADDKNVATSDRDTDIANEDGPAPECHSAEVLSLPMVGEETEWAKRIGDLRAKLIGEFDRPDSNVAVTLARVYLGSGLTDEALAVLANFGDGGPVSTVITELGQVLGGRGLAETASLMRPDCLGPQALWRALALAKSGDAKGAMAAEQASGRALEKLPPAVRREVAARLGVAAADIGAWDEARRFHGMIRRSEAEHTSASGWSDLLAARLAIWSGEETEILRALTAARNAQPDVATPATLMMAEHVLASQQTNRRGIVALITDLGLIARMSRGTAEGQRAADLEVRLTDRLRGRTKAMDLLTLGLALGNFTEESFTKTLSTLIEGADEAGRNSIASIYLEDREAFGPALQDARFREVLAKSLIELGLPSQAAGLFDAKEVPENVGLSLAEGFLAVGDARAAVTVIADLKESPERERLRRAAMALLGEPVADENLAAKEKPSKARLIAMGRAAIAAGDMDRALELTLQRLTESPDVETAETAALIALAAGEKAIPPSASAILQDGSPELHTRLTTLFSEPPAAMDPKDPTTAAAFLKRLDAEIAVMEDVLEDG